MSFEKQEGDSWDVGFSVPAAGKNIWQIQEGITRFDSDSGAKQIMFPLVCVKSVEGDTQLEDRAGWFINVTKKNGDENKMAWDPINKLLSGVNLIDKFKEKFGPSTRLDSEPILLAFQKALPDKKICLTHEIRVFEGRENFDVKKIARASAGKIPKEEPETKEEEGSSEDW